MKLSKKLAVILAALSLMVQPLTANTVMAANDGISTQSINTEAISTLLQIDSSDGVTRCIANVIGKTNTSRIEGTLKLKKVTSSGTTTVKNWSVATSGQILSVSKTCYVLSRGTYRLELKVKVTRNGTSETLTASHTTKY